MTRKVARDATPEAVDSAIEEGLSDENQQTVAAAIEPEHVEEATEKLAAGATDGWIDAMDQGERQQRLTAALSPMVVSLVSESMETALSDENLERVRDLAKQATLGFQDAIDEVAEQRETGAIPSEKGNVLEAADKMAEDGGTLLTLLGVLAAILAALLGIGVVWAIGRRRRHEKEAARRDRELEAAVRMLARDGTALVESRSARAEGRADQEVQAETDAELVRSAMQRLTRARDDETKKRGASKEVRHS